MARWRRRKGGGEKGSPWRGAGMNERETKVQTRAKKRKKRVAVVDGVTGVAGGGF